MENGMISKLHDGKVIFGFCNTYPAAGIIEAISHRYDFVWIDGQHGQYSYDSILSSVRTSTACAIDSMIRVPGHSPEILGLIADMSPSAILVPMVNTLSEAEQIVNALHFAPSGERSFGGRRPIDIDGREFYRGQMILTVLQIETLKAARNVEAIANKEGVDCLFFGSDDMRIDLGLSIGTTLGKSKELRKVMASIAKASQKAGIYAGCVATNRKALLIAVDMGYQLIAGGGDAAFLKDGARNRLIELQSALATRQ